MCRMAFISDGTTCDTQAELKLALGMDLSYFQSAPPGARSDPSGCLCWVDMPATAERAGYSAKDAGGDWDLVKL